MRIVGDVLFLTVFWILSGSIIIGLAAFAIPLVVWLTLHFFTDFIPWWWHAVVTFNHCLWVGCT